MINFKAKWALLGIAVLSSTAVLPSAQAKTSAKNVKASAKKSAVKIVSVCPVMQHEVPKVEANAVRVGNVKAYVCCGGCKAKFNGYTPEQKKQALRSAMKKQAGAKA